MAIAAERIVVQTTAQEKKEIVAKAEKLGPPISELMRRGATAYQEAGADEGLGRLADSAKSTAERAGPTAQSWCDDDAPGDTGGRCPFPTSSSSCCRSSR